MQERASRIKATSEEISNKVDALEKMKGNISFESEVGKGTTFTINIPNARTEHI